jgi:hypothetical protein
MIQRILALLAAAVPVLLMIAFVAFMVIGWVRNIVKLFYCDFSTVEAIEVVRIVGIVVAPIGGIFGWL